MFVSCHEGSIHLSRLSDCPGTLQNLKNNEDSWYAHNIDLHAVNGPGGGASLGAPGPGESYSFRFKRIDIVPRRATLLVARDGERTYMTGPFRIEMLAKGLNVIAPPQKGMEIR